MTRSARVRAILACWALAGIFTLFSWRLIQLQVRQHEKWAAVAEGGHRLVQAIPAHRGLILDINGQTLADNDPAFNVVADCSVLADPDDAAAVMAGPLGMDEAALRAKLSAACSAQVTDKQGRTHRGLRYVVLKKDISDAAVTALANRLAVHSIRGILFPQDPQRVYPNGTLACHLVGFMDGNHNGVQGIERQEDQYLRGHDGYRETERDRTGRELVAYRGIERAPRDGANVRLTVDLNLQNIVETELDAACAQFHPKKAIAIMMRPATGEILAMANRPNFDPNDIRTKPASFIQDHMAAMKNCAVEDMMEPGSTFKMVTAAGALNEHLVQPSSVIFCENGAYSYAGRILHDHHPYGDLTVEDILVKSSNIGAAKLAMDLGDQRLYGYIRSFGFGERTGVALPGEISGLVNPLYRWTKLSITRIPMGQEVAVTPIQTIAALCAIANGGHLMMPQIVHDITGPDGQVIASFPPVEIRQVVSAAAAREVTQALQGVVSAKGTAALAKVSGFTVAGKTGTAEKIDPHGGYMAGKYIVSFVGFLPADNPAFACLVMLDDAQTGPDQDYGGLVAAPVFSRIAEKAARYMNLEPSPEPADTTVVLNQAAQPRHHLEHD